MTLMPLLRTLHAWTGAILSLILILLGLSGSALIVREDVLRWTDARPPADVSPQALGAVLEGVERRHPGAARLFSAAGPRSGVHHIYRTDGSSVLASDGSEAAPSALDAAFESVEDLHKALFAGRTGRAVVGLVGLAGAGLVLTGFVVWAPTWRSFRLRLWPRNGRRGELVSVHRNLGALFALPVLVFCITGAAVAFDSASHKLLVRLFPQPVAPAPVAPPAGTGDIDWPRALAAAQARFPEGRLRGVTWPDAPGEPAIVRLRRPGDWRGADEAVVWIDPATSNVIHAAERESAPQGAAIQSALDSLHVAAFGGRAYELLAGLSGLALAALGGLGLWGFVIKPRRRRAPA